jgi:hypothetical protein
MKAPGLLYKALARVYASQFPFFFSFLLFFPATRAGIYLYNRADMSTPGSAGT